VSLRTGCLAVLVGLLAAFGLFAWSEMQAGRSPVARLIGATPSPSPRPTAVGQTPTSAAAAPRPAAPTATAAPQPTRAAPSPTATLPSPTATVRPAPTPTAPPPTPATRQVGISLDELDRELKQTLEASGAPLRSPVLRFLPPDGVGLQGRVPLAIFQVPVDIEARLSVDERGQVRVTTSRVQAVGASLPDAVTAELGRRVDDQGTRAIAEALPPDAVARRVVVEPDRIQVELAP
jgi:hypothetical protein